MRKKSAQYYIKTVQLKSWALFYKLTEDTTYFINKKNNLKKNYQKSFQPLSASFFGNARPLYYYTYKHFRHPNQLAQTLVFNDQKVAYNSINNPFESYNNPLFTAYHALVLFNHYITDQDEASLSTFWHHVDFLESLGHWQETSFLLSIPFDYPFFKLKAPWLSGLAQATAASVFYRAYLQSKNEKYLKYQAGAIVPTHTDMQGGGVMIEIDSETVWIEEYPSPTPSMVLNGFIFTIIATLELAHFLKSTTHLNTANKLLKSLIYHLHQFDYDPYWRYGQLHKQFSNLEYQGLYVHQFLHLYQLTKLPIFQSIALRMNNHINWKEFYYFYNISNYQATTNEEIRGNL